MTDLNKFIGRIKMPRDSMTYKEVTMALQKEQKQGTISDFRKTPSDTGSAEVQVALLTERINMLTEHLKSHKKDHSSRRGLLRLVSRRKKLLEYLKKDNFDSYQKVIEKLGLRK